MNWGRFQELKCRGLFDCFHWEMYTEEMGEYSSLAMGGDFGDKHIEGIPRDDLIHIIIPERLLWNDLFDN